MTEVTRDLAHARALLDLKRYDEAAILDLIRWDETSRYLPHGTSVTARDDIPGDVEPLPRYR
jgi:hypothetical protein